MLSGIHPLLTGRLLLHLDGMGHSDAVVVVDAHFPAESLAARFVEMPGASAPAMLQAVRTVVPLDVDPVDLMATPEEEVLPIHRELENAAGVEVANYLSRREFYERAASAFVIIRTGETRTYANSILRKGVVPPWVKGAV